MCKKSKCNSCNGCQNKVKPKDCKSDGCGRCCGGGKNIENEFLLTLLEKQYLPVIYYKDKLIFKENKDTTSKDVEEFLKVIDKFEKLGYLTLDNYELDEYSYLDYEKEMQRDDCNIQNITKGTIAITEVCLNIFLS